MNLRAARAGWSLRTRLMLAQGIVVGAGILTAALVAAIVGPQLFHEHLLQAGQEPNSPELMHSEEAYASANTIALGAALPPNDPTVARPGDGGHPAVER